MIYTANGEFYKNSKNNFEKFSNTSQHEHPIVNELLGISVGLLEDNALEIGDNKASITSLEDNKLKIQNEINSINQEIINLKNSPITNSKINLSASQIDIEPLKSRITELENKLSNTDSNNLSSTDSNNFSAKIKILENDLEALKKNNQEIIHDESSKRYDLIHDEIHRKIESNEENLKKMQNDFSKMSSDYEYIYDESSKSYDQIHDNINTKI